MIALVAIGPVADGVLERIFLTVNRAGLKLRDRSAQAHRARLSAQQLEQAGLDAKAANRKAVQVGRRMHRPDAVGYVAKAILEKAEYMEVRIRFNPALRRLPQRPIHGGSCLGGVGEQER